MGKSIVKACVKYNDRLYTGFDHGECFRKLNEDNTIIVHSEIEQGFVDNDGNFVDRKQAMIIAKESGQLTYENDKKTLISEDLHLNWLNKQDQRISELEEQLKNAIVPKFKIGQEVFYIAPKRQIVKASVIGCFEDGLIVQCKNRIFIKLLNENVFVCEEDAKIGIEKYYKSIHKNYNRNKLNNVYRKMKDRCYNPKSLSYINYGAIGITVCDEWKNSYNKFKAWAENNGYEEDIMPNGRNRLTLDRIDNTKGYCPSNCRWVTQKDQQNNRRNNRNIKLEELQGE